MAKVNGNRAVPPSATYSKYDKVLEVKVASHFGCLQAVWNSAVSFYFFTR